MTAGSIIVFSNGHRKMAAKGGSHLLLAAPCLRRLTPASNVVVRFWAHGMSDCQRLCRGETKHGLVHDVPYQNSLPPHLKGVKIR